MRPQARSVACAYSGGGPDEAIILVLAPHDVLLTSPTMPRPTRVSIQQVRTARRWTALAFLCACTGACEGRIELWRSSPTLSIDGQVVVLEVNAGYSYTPMAGQEDVHAPPVPVDRSDRNTPHV